MSALETRIDGLYALPLAEFTEARNALAKSLAGDERAQVKALEKPTVVPWAVNQIYWHERTAWNRAMAAGSALRAAQLEALQGNPAGLRDASTAHRTAVSAAVAAAQHLAGRHGARAAADDLSRMLEAISLAAEPPATPGRFTQAVQPAGFEALSGFTPAVLPGRPVRPQSPPPSQRPTAPSTKTSTKAAARAEAEAERRRAADEAARSAAEAAVTQARAALADAEAEFAAAQKMADAAKRELVQAEHAAHTARVVMERARAALADRESRRRSL